MSSSPAKDLLQLLRGAGFSDDLLFWGQQPDDPDRCITLKDTGGPEPLFTHDNYQTERPTVQVLVRAAKGQDVWDDASAAFAALKGYNLTLGGTVYQAIQPQGSPADLGRDSRNRREVSFNLQLHRSG